MQFLSFHCLQILVDMDRRCVICNEGESSGESNVRKKGLNGLKESSRLRQDGKHNMMAGLCEAFIHYECRKNYTRKRSIHFDLKRERKNNEILEVDHSGPCHGTKRRTAFNFSTCCLFCAELIDEAFYKERKKSRKYCRHTVCKVQKDYTSKVLKEAALIRDDELGRKVLQRLSLAQSLVESGAMYHKDCYSSFMIVQQFKRTGRP